MQIFNFQNAEYLLRLISVMITCTNFQFSKRSIAIRGLPRRAAALQTNKQFLLGCGAFHALKVQSFFLGCGASRVCREEQRHYRQTVSFGLWSFSCSEGPKCFWVVELSCTDHGSIIIVTLFCGGTLLLWHVHINFSCISILNFLGTLMK